MPANLTDVIGRVQQVLVPAEVDAQGCVGAADEEYDDCVDDDGGELFLVVAVAQRVGEQDGRPRHERDAEEQCDVEHEHLRVDALESGEGLVVGQPDRGGGEERCEVGEVGGPVAQQLFTGGDVFAGEQVEDQQREHDCEGGVGEAV